MRLSALNHLTETVVSLAKCDAVHVLGSSSLLASFPELGEAGGPLELSQDADLLIQPCDDQIAAMVHEAVGEGSLFARRHGYHIDLLRPDIVETLPPGWEARVVVISQSRRIDALSPEDLLVVKLRAGRAKDLDLCRAVFSSTSVRPETIRARLDATPLQEAEIIPVYRRLGEVAS